MFCKSMLHEWHPETACNFVIESVPSHPYGFLPSHFNTVEANQLCLSAA